MRLIDLEKPLFDSEGALHRLVAQSELQFVTVGAYGIFSVWDKSTGSCLNAECSYLLISNGTEPEDQDKWDNAVAARGLLIAKNDGKVH